MIPLDSIDKSTLAIAKADDEVYKDMTQLADELPPNQPRYILLSYPMTLVCIWSTSDILR